MTFRKVPRRGAGEASPMSGTRKVVTLAAAVLVLSQPGGARASMPVEATVTGCVTDGRFVGGRAPGDRYVIRPVTADGMRPVGLRRFEGRRIRLEGALLPGDRLILRGTPVVLGTCR